MDNLPLKTRFSSNSSQDSCDLFNLFIDIGGIKYPTKLLYKAVNKLRNYLIKSYQVSFIRRFLWFYKLQFLIFVRNIVSVSVVLSSRSASFSFHILTWVYVSRNSIVSITMANTQQCCSINVYARASACVYICQLFYCCLSLSLDFIVLYLMSRHGT